MRSRSCLVALFLAVSLVASASRATRRHSLSECIREAELILLGRPIRAEDDGHMGVLKVKVLRVLKGRLEDRHVLIAHRSFHSSRPRWIGGPVEVHPKQIYLFFLKAERNQKGQYTMFDRDDGVIQSSNPVILEIQNQVKKQDPVRELKRGNKPMESLPPVTPRLAPQSTDVSRS